MLDAGEGRLEEWGYKKNGMMDEGALGARHLFGGGHSDERPCKDRGNDRRARRAEQRARHESHNGC